jgi:D-sorbitol dehydrogenase (acceptor)
VSALDGKTVIVTGAASGLGLACANAALAAGARVCVSDLDAARLQDVWSTDDRSEVVCLQAADITRSETADALISETIGRFGGLHGLVNAAGIFDTRQFLEIEPEHFDRIFDVHVRAAFFLMQAVARSMSARGARGSIVNFSSSAGRAPRPLAAHYGAAKAAVISFTRSASVALAADGIRVNCVCPGLIETPMMAEIRKQRSELLGLGEDEINARWQQLVPMGRLGTPEEVAAVVVFLLSDASSFVTGEAIGINGGTDAS